MSEATAPWVLAERGADAVTPYMTFDRAEWAALRATTPLTLSEDELATLRGLNDRLSLDEVTDIYLPLSRLLNLHVAAAQDLYRTTDAFLGQPTAKVPYVIGVAGSVAVGKSTTARILQALLTRWPDHPTVDLVTTDGFLYPNAVLEERGLLNRKGFPESYDVRRLVRFVADVKSGAAPVEAPVYDHLTYDVVPGASVVVDRPDIVIVEGLNVLQTTSPTPPTRMPAAFVSDYFDFSVYVDADEDDIIRWYVERFLALRDTAFRDPSSFFHRFAALTEPEAVETATGIWSEINGINLHQNIAPTRTRARLVLEKAVDHAVRQVHLRKL